MAKRRITVEIDAALIDRAQGAGLNLAQVVQAAIEDALSRGVSEQGSAFDEPGAGEARARAWSRENAEALQDYRRRIDERGVFGEEWRRW